MWKHHSLIAILSITGSISHIVLEFFALHGIMANLKDDVGMVVDVVESKIFQGVLLTRVILFTQCSKNCDPV